MDLFNVISFDPGKNLGFCKMSVDPLTFQILNVESRTYYLDDKIYSPFAMFNKLEYLSQIVRSVLLESKPIIVGMEQVFKHRFANAVIQLAQYTATIEYNVRTFDPYMLFCTYPPKAVKRAIGATGDADKYKMLETVSKIQDIKPFIRSDVTDHEVDAIAIAYIALQDFKKYPQLLLMSRI